MQYGDEKRDRLEKLEKKLYSRNAPGILDEGRSELNTIADGEEERKEVNESWDDVRTSGFDELAARVSKLAENRHTFMKKILI